MAEELTNGANVVSVVGHASGLWYGEIVFVSGVMADTFLPCDLGCGTSVPPTTGSACTQPGFGYRKNGKIMYNGNQIGSAETALSDGDVVMIAINLTSGKGWVGRNGTWILSGDPAAGTNETTTIGAGTWYLGASLYSPGTTEQLTATLRVSAAQFSYSIPSGFSAWGA
jgi:hypothetical protein